MSLQRDFDALAPFSLYIHVMILPQMMNSKSSKRNITRRLGNIIPTRVATKKHFNTFKRRLNSCGIYMGDNSNAKMPERIGSFPRLLSKPTHPKQRARKRKRVQQTKKPLTCRNMTLILRIKRRRVGNFTKPLPRKNNLLIAWNWPNRDVASAPKRVKRPRNANNRAPTGWTSRRPRRLSPRRLPK